MRQASIARKSVSDFHSACVQFFPGSRNGTKALDDVFFLIVTLAVMGASGPTNVSADETHTELLRQAETAASKYRDDSNDSDRKSELKSDVRSLVEKSFQVRQASQRKQLQKMRNQLHEAEAALDRREAIRNRIVARKVGDLLSGQSANWKEANKSEPMFDVIGIGNVPTEA